MYELLVKDNYSKFFHFFNLINLKSKTWLPESNLLS